jgi:hypothetical protein
MKYIAFLLSVLIITSCSQQTQDESSENQNEETEMTGNTDGWSYFGDTIDNNNILNADEVMVMVNESGSANVKLEGSIEECCQKKGCWMKVNVEGMEESMRVTFKDYGFFVPLNSAGNSVVMEGIVSFDTVEVDVLKHYAEDAGKTQEEIDAITEPEINLAFEAHGVMIKEKS